MSHPDQHTINLLLEKHALGICTPEERAVLEKWYAAFPVDGQLFHDELEKQEVKASLKKGIFGAIGEEIAGVNEEPSGRIPLLQQEVKPLTVVDNRPVRRMYWRAAAAILVLMATGSLFYLFSGKKEVISFTEVSAPVGKRILHMQLPDGSDMWLEPGSRLRYASDFGKQSRDVQIVDGLAYFSVVPAATHPFTVTTTSGITAKVLGTEFSVKAYQGLADIQVYVGSGMVQVSDSHHILGVLEADQQIVYQLATHTATRFDGRLDDWRQGSLLLQNVPFEEVARILQNRYQVRVAYDTAMMYTYRFNLGITEKASLDEVLEMLKDLSGMTYTLHDGRVTVTGVEQ
jgi:transmembrane sensor